MTIDIYEFLTSIVIQMRIYLIQNKKICELEDNDEFHVIDFSGRKMDLDNEFGLRVDDVFSVENRGYPISSFEFSIYCRHFLVWQDLADSDDEYALIMENVEKLSFTIDDIKNFVSTFEQDWNIVFPFDGFKKSQERNCSYLLGFRWGTDAYFVNRNCLPLLLENRNIGLPIDEQLLTYNRENIIHIHYEDVDMFIYGDNNKYEVDCNISKLNQILRTNVWDAKDRFMAKRLLKDLCGLLHANKVEYFISEGTLLGCIRHNKIMDWDDDIDISINCADMGKVIEAINSSGKYKITERYWTKAKHVYYKISFQHSKAIANFPYGFPFIDIWIYVRSEDSIRYNHGAAFPKDIIFPTQNRFFEGARVKTPKKPAKYLDLKYGDWKTKISIYRWSHKNEKALLYPLSAKITVDKNGLFHDLKNFDSHYRPIEL